MLVQCCGTRCCHLSSDSEFGGIESSQCVTHIADRFVAGLEWRSLQYAARHNLGVEGFVPVSRPFSREVEALGVAARGSVSSVSKHSVEVTK